MSSFVQGFLDNDSFFGKFMTKLGIIIGANLMFILFSIPFFTVGAGLVALYHVMLKTLRGDGVLNPFKEFWNGFKANFRQGTISWLITVVLAVVLYADIKICKVSGGIMSMVSVLVYGLIVLLTVSYIFLLPTMAAFADTIPHLIRNGWFFALRRPFASIVIIFFDAFPLILTYSDKQNLPLYAFLWCLFGFGAIAMLGSTLLLKQFEEFLPKDEEEEEWLVDPKADEEAMLNDLRMMDGL
ncbi:MAG: YesL family protein [Lachnospiraceae bacterium]|nr:YesL family protein [Lachnospiraceae bacterium]